jgi:acetyltransferase-like isoleucine patch superfamily enzyme
MIDKIIIIIKGYGYINGFLHIIFQIFIKICCKLRAKSLGWRNARIPVFSRVINPLHMKIGKNFYAASPVWIEAVVQYKSERYTPFIEIGDDFSCSESLHISSVNHITIGDRCLFGSNVYVGDHNHGCYRGSIHSNPLEPPSMRRLHSDGKIQIGNDCWFGNNVVILSPSLIEDGVVVAANSIVKGCFKKDTMIAGSPARVVKYFDRETNKWIKK